MQNIFNILPVSIVWLLSSYFPSLVIFILGFLQPQLHQANTGLIGFFICQFVLKQFSKLA